MASAEESRQFASRSFSGYKIIGAYAYKYFLESKRLEGEGDV